MQFHKNIYFSHKILIVHKTPMLKVCIVYER